MIRLLLSFSILTLKRVYATYRRIYATLFVSHSFQLLHRLSFMNSTNRLILSMNKAQSYFVLFSVPIFAFFVCSRALSQTALPFSYTGGAQTFTVPCGVDSIHVKTWGAGGSGGGADSYGGAVGGAGAFVESDIFVTPGQLLTIVVGGGAGPGANCAGGAPGGPSGWGNAIFNGGPGGNAGGSGCSGGGGGGGGGSGILSSSTLLLVAGGGGGGSGGGQFSSGATGGGGGQDGNPSPGSCSSPGIAGASSSGNGLQGANKGGADGGGGGGGGGGYVGGSGGGVATGCDCGACGGGGGTSWSSGINTTILNGSGQTPGNSTDPDLPAGVAIGGGTSTEGGDGYIILSFYGGPPEADFSSTTVCQGNATQFTNNSITSDGTIISVSWNYGNGSPLDATFNPVYIYPNGGNYNVTLIVTNNFGCSDTITKPVQIYYKPTAGFSSADVCLGDSVNFTNNSSINPGGTIAGYLWKFDDGTTSLIQNPAHKYSAGTYSPVLIVTSTDMCIDSTTGTVNTFDPPTSSFTTTNTCLLDSAAFTNNSINPVMGNLISWYWNFGDGSPINTTLWNPHHLYSTPGNYDVSLITHSSNLGCADTMKTTVTIYPMPIADYSSADVCLVQVANFTDLSIVSNGSITNWGWNFGDGTPIATLQNPTHTYTTPGTYSVSLIVTTNNGCKNAITKSIIIHPMPDAGFNTSNVCDGDYAQFYDSSTITGPDIIQLYNWDFGDGNSVSNQNASHSYADTGTYTVKLLVVSNFGCSDSITHTIVVNPNPTVNFTASNLTGCEPLCISLFDSSSIAGGNAISWTWNLGDGSPTSTTQDQQHCYTNQQLFAPVSFSPSLTVISDSGCVTSLTKNNYITVYPLPNAIFTINPQTTSIVDPVITITDSSIGTDTWSWNFGDWDTSSVSNPQTHTYADTGTYQIVLIASTQYSCADTTYQTVIVEPDFEVYIPNAFTPNGDGINDSFICKSIFATDFKMTIFDRWGNLIYRTDGLDKPWDGKANYGTDIAESDIYIYAIEITDFKNKKHNYKGIVTLLK